jgi:hypothetical protein
MTDSFEVTHKGWRKTFIFSHVSTPWRCTGCRQTKRDLTLLGIRVAGSAGMPATCINRGRRIVQPGSFRLHSQPSASRF